MLMSTGDTTPQQDAADVIIIGSGAGGCAAAYNLVRAGLRVMLLEKGGELPRDASTLDVQQVIHDGRFKSSEDWLDGGGRRFRPEEYFNLGGKTKWYGAALLRYGRHEFDPESRFQCPGWPIGCEEFAPYYEQAERLLAVRNFDCEPDLQRIIDRLARTAPDWECRTLPLGLSSKILDEPREASHFDGFASPLSLKSDAQTSFLEPIKASANLLVRTNATVTDLLPAAGDPARVAGVRLADGTEFTARAVLLAAGALHSPRLLQGYIKSQRLAARLPCPDLVGRNLKMHLLTAMIALSPSRKTDLIRKTRLFVSADVPHSSVQPLGFDGELIGNLVPGFVPRWVARQIGARSYGFFLQTEDGAHPDNRVIAASPETHDLPVLDYDPARSPAALAEHEQLVRGFRRALRRCGMLAFSERVGSAGTAHVSGTLAAGADPSRSVVDASAQVRGIDALYVVDGSVLPRSSRVNPSLSIYAWALRASEKLAARLAPGAVSTLSRS